MARNVFVTITAADDDSATFDENEVSNAIDMQNVEKATFGVAGTFDGATVTLQISMDGVTFVSSGLTAAAAGRMELTTPCKQARISIAGGTAPELTCAAALRTLD
jgi:hypothetical protein